MNSQEMATAAINGVPVKVLIIDNRALGMVHQWQHLFYNDRFSFTDARRQPRLREARRRLRLAAPSRIERPDEVDAALDEMLASDEPLPARRDDIPAQQTVYPMVAPGRPTTYGRHHGGAPFARTAAAAGVPRRRENAASAA